MNHLHGKICQYRAKNIGMTLLHSGELFNICLFFAEHAGESSSQKNDLILLEPRVEERVCLSPEGTGWLV